MHPDSSGWSPDEYSAAEKCTLGRRYGWPELCTYKEVQRQEQVLLPPEEARALCETRYEPDETCMMAHTSLCSHHCL